ncbi:hypothetical protein F5883DRAFT_148766 [Diaporthe sp. PMI_573]|nr:hypothetical protein F5883DRAFT_148766 [Diaporthaceae sp. PMI_573]
MITLLWSTVTQSLTRATLTIFGSTSICFLIYRLLKMENRQVRHSLPQSAVSVSVWMSGTQDIAHDAMRPPRPPRLCQVGMLQVTRRARSWLRDQPGISQ